MCASSAVKASRRRSFWRGVSLRREARKRLRTWGEGVACACAVTGRVLLDAAAYLTWSVAREFDDMEGTSDAGGVLEQAKRWRSCCPWKGSSVAIWIPERKSSPRSSSQFSCAVPDLPGTRSNKGPWGGPSLVSGPRCR